MLYLDKKRLDDVLVQKNTTLNGLANACGISRQSIYQMFEERSVFNTSFEKMLKFLNCSHEDLTRDTDSLDEFIRIVPPYIRGIISELHAFSEKNETDLYILFPNGKGRFGFSKDWTFGLYFTKKDRERKMSTTRQEILNRAAPYRIEIVNLSRAPTWYLTSAKDGHIKVFGTTSDETVFGGIKT